MKKALLFSLISVFAIAAAAPYMSVDALMKDKAKFDKKDVTVRGKVDKFAAKTSKKGNAYTTFMLKGEKLSVSVYMNSHLPKPLKNGDLVEVKGNFTLKKTVGMATFENEIDISKKDGKKYGVTAVKWASPKMDQPNLIAVMGPTASGKSTLAEAIADRLDAQLINADAFQVYKGFDIGTSKPTAKTKYQLLDILDPQELFSVGLFIQRVLPILEELFASGKSAVVVGGTGLNIRALFEEYTDLTGPASPEALVEIEAIENDAGEDGLITRLRLLAPEAEIDWNNPVRVRRRLIKELSESEPIEFKLPPFHKLKAAVSPPVPVINERIRTRISSMIQDGWLEESARLISEGVRRTDPAMRAIGYLELSLVQAGELELDSALTHIETATRQYAKRQRSWLRTEPNINWVEWSDDPSALADWVHLNLLPK